MRPDIENTLLNASRLSRALATWAYIYRICSALYVYHQLNVIRFLFQVCPMNSNGVYLDLSLAIKVEIRDSHM